MDIDRVVRELTLMKEKESFLSYKMPVYDEAIRYLQELKEYKALGLSPKQLKEIDECYKKLATENAKLKKLIEKGEEK